ncbi:NPCBM/NEW2 domain-containing protein [Deinococcus frigens]|uniref:NPCBM/NEW2 domain-containing protein n=2 Tax=Deinococcus frigens TaxID=249403 RepID=UPI0039EFA783
MTEEKKGKRPGKWARGMALALLGAGLLIGCGPSNPPTPGPGPAPTDPYAGGKSYPWVGQPDAKPRPLTQGQNFLSDLSYAAARNAWGPIELDRSNGTQQGGDGETLTLGTQTFKKGIGVHAGSELTYTLNAQCSTFSATVGIDEEVGEKGSVVFEVYGDGKLLTASGKMTGADAAKVLTAPLEGVKELRLVVTNAGDGIAYDHADWADAQVTCELADSVPPVAPQGLTATASSAGITLNWADNKEPDLAGYRVSRSVSAGGPFTVLTTTPLTASSYTDTAAPQGTVSYYQVVAVDKSGNASAPSSASATRPGTVLGRATLANLDGGPFADRLVFNRIGSLVSPPGNGVHDRATLRITNTGTGTLQITGLPLTDTWELDPALTLPLDIAPGQFQDVKLRFTAQSVKVHAGTLTVESNDPTAPGQVIQLAGLWQSQSESGQEPSLEDIVQRGFGFKTAFAPGSDINKKGRVTPQGDEVIAPYWQRADAARPVKVQQLAAYHTQGNTATLRWFAKGDTVTNTVLSHAGIDAQSVLPRKNGTNSNELATATFAPASTFGFRVDSENSDPTLNNQTKDRSNGCVDPCGQHVRFFKARDQGGQIMPDTYLLIMDYAGINYDYNDNIYLISNIKPAPILINVGTASGYKFTDPVGNVWVSDRDRNGYALFTPSTIIDEPAGGPNPSLDILKTSNDTLYQTYRGNVGNIMPRAVSFNIPLENGPQTLRLHFADLAHSVAGKRIFDVFAEGQKVLSNLDIVQEAGGGNTALVKTVSVQVTGGLLTLNLSASVDYPSIAGIEIVR